MGYDVILTTGMSQSLYSLQQIDSLMTTTNNRLATGKKVNSALDDPINYFASQDHLYRASDLQGRKDEMNEAIQLIKTANGGIEAILDLIDSAVSLANAAKTGKDPAEVATLELQYNDILAQIDLLVNDSFYKGTNLLQGGDLTVNLNEDGSSQLNLDGTPCDYESLGLSLTAAGAWWDTTASPAAPDTTAIDIVLTGLANAKTTLRTLSKTLSLDLSTIQIRKEFADEMINVLNDGAANLVTADANAESAKLLMLQTQQSLSLNSLSISSSAYQGVLKLFG